jgi:hypothetical protein
MRELTRRPVSRPKNIFSWSAETENGNPVTPKIKNAPPRKFTFHFYAFYCPASESRTATLKKQSIQNRYSRSPNS